MAVACTCFDNGNSCVLDHSLYEVRTSAGDDNVNVSVEAHELGSCLAVCLVDYLYDIRREPCFFHSLPHYITEADIGIDSFLAALEDDHVSCLKAERSRVYRNIGARLEDNADNSERYSCLDYLQAVGTDTAADDLSDRILEGDELVDALGNAFYALFVELQSVLLCFGHAVSLRSGYVLCVFSDYKRFIFYKSL